MSDEVSAGVALQGGAEEVLVDKEVIAKRLGISVRKVDQLRARKALPFYVIPSRCIRFKPSECDEAMRRFRVPAKGEISLSITSQTGPVSLRSQSKIL